MEELRIERRPELERPVLIAAFRGWNDGAQGASRAGGYLAKIWNAQQFASIDPETFYDFQATRPMVSLVDGITRRVDWPDNDFYSATPEGLGRGALLLLGVEPNLRWKRFTSLIVDLAREYVQELEQRAEMIDETDLPSGDSLAAELTRFLREHDEQDGPPDVATDQ